MKVRYEVNLLQKVSNAIGITNKLLNSSFPKIDVGDFNKNNISEYFAESDNKISQGRKSTRNDDFIKKSGIKTNES